MRTYIRETINLGKGRRMITTYSPGEYFFSNIVKFFLYLFVVWPIQLIFWCFLWTLKIILVIIQLPFIHIVKLIGKIVGFIFHR